MKLYTENQVRTAIRDAYWCCSKLEVECVFDKLPPIELPSDEEIGQEFKHGSENWEVRQALEVGAKWMRDKIQGGKK